MIWGYFLKLVIADRIAIFVDNVYANVDIYDGRYLLLASVLFAFQIYCDFWDIPQSQLSCRGYGI